MSDIDEVLSKFGNAEYSKGFWESMRKRIAAEHEQSLKEEYEAAEARRKALNKNYGPLKHD